VICRMSSLKKVSRLVFSVGLPRECRQILEPMKAAADVKARETSYLDFVDKHPEMRDASFKKDVAGLVRPC
jgi:hypothetical protein